MVYIRTKMHYIHFVRRMSQKHFDVRVRCDDLETRNAELETKNAALKEKISDLAFEITLLKEVCDFEQEEQKDALIENLREQIREKNIQECRLEMNIHEKETEIAALQATIVEKDEEITRLNLLLNQRSEALDINLIDVFDDAESNEKMGEDLGEESVVERNKTRKRNNPEINLFVGEEFAPDEEVDDDFVEKPVYKKKKKYPLVHEFITRMVQSLVKNQEHEPIIQEEPELWILKFSMF